MNPHSFENSGGLPSPKDKRDFTDKKVDALLGFATPTPRQPVDILKLPIYYQGKIGACVGHAIAWAMTYLDFLESGEVRTYSPRFVYALAKRDDKNPGTQGTDPRIALKEVQSHGVCDDPQFPNDVTLSYADYIDTTKISQAAYDNALPRELKNYVLITDLSVVGLKAAIDKYKTVPCLVNLGKEWWTNATGDVSWLEADVLPVKPPKVIVSGHEICLFDYDNNNRFYFVNSWSKEWGRMGVGYFDVNYLPFIVQAHGIIDLPDWIVANLLQQKSLLEKVVELLKKLLGK